MRPIRFGVLTDKGMGEEGAELLSDGGTQRCFSQKFLELT
jgi:hypothetical protein